MDSINNELLDNFSKEIRKKLLQDASEISNNLILILKQLILQSSWKNASEIRNVIIENGKELISNFPNETCIGNILHRVLNLVGGKTNSDVEGSKNKHRKKQFIEKLSDKYDDTTMDFKSVIIEDLNELLTELEYSRENIAAFSLDHIYSKEIILTIGKSKSVEMFLKRAAKKRKFQVLVVETSPNFKGHEMAVKLSNEKIDTVVITDSAVFAMMAQVSKVIVSTHTVTADGGLKAIAGTNAIALAAKFHSVPLIVLASLYKLSSRHLCSFDRVESNVFLSPNNVLPFTEGEILSKVQVYNPVFDFVAPELVSLIITNLAEYPPFYVYKQVSDIYSQEDAF